MKHVIIGAGAAGVTASKKIRELGRDNEIVIVSTDDSIHSRCMLGSYISGERDEKGLSFIPDGFFKDANIRWLGGVIVKSVDTDNRHVLFDGGAEAYDRLLIATGSNNIIPPVKGLREARNVYGLRHLSDAKAIRKNTANMESVVIIGAGLVGLNAAYALIAMGKKPVVVEALDSIIPLNLDKRAAGAYLERFEQAGCSFHLGRKVVEASLDESNAVTSITFDNGERIPCESVISATSTRPAIDFLANSNVACSGGVIVDKYLATNVDGVYAAGDVTGLSGIWPNAMKQGTVAAKNMCGTATVFSDSFSAKNTVNFFGLQSLSVGITEPAEDDTVEIREDRNNYEKIILRNGTVAGIIIQGNISNSGIWQYLVKNKLDVSMIKKPVRKLSFADFYGVEANGEYKWS